MRKWAAPGMFLLIFSGFALCLAPGPSWANLNVDLFDFLYSTKELQVAHPPGLPLYILLGHLVSYLPGSHAINLAYMLSLVPTMLTCLLIHYIVEGKSANRYAPFVAVLAFAGSQVVIAQATIVEIYALETFLVVGAYVLFEKGRPKLALLALGGAAAISWGAIILVPIFLWRYGYHRRPLMWLYLLPPLALYAYVPLANRAPHLSLGPSTWDNYYSYFVQHGGALWNLPAWEFPERFALGAAALVACLGLALVLAIGTFIKREHITLLWLAIPGFAFWITTSGADAIVQIMPSLAFLAIAAGLYLRPTGNGKRLAYAAILVSSLLFMVNLHLYDIGGNLDPHLRANQLMGQLDQVPEGSVMVCWSAASYAGVHYYNSETGRELKAIHPVFTDPEYAWDYELERYGLVYDWGQTWDEDIRTDESLWPGATADFADANPGETVYVIANSPDRSERQAVVLPAMAELPAPHGEYKQSWTRFVLPIHWTYAVQSGQYAMTEQWQLRTDTNLTIGIFGLIIAFGLTWGHTAPRTIFRNVEPKRRQAYTTVGTAILTLLYCWMLSLVGVGGFRW